MVSKCIKYVPGATIWLKWFLPSQSALSVYRVTVPASPKNRSTRLITNRPLESKIRIVTLEFTGNEYSKSNLSPIDGIITYAAGLISAFTIFGFALKSPSGWYTTNFSG